MGTNEATLIYGYFSKIILGSTLLFIIRKSLL